MDDVSVASMGSVYSIGGGYSSCVSWCYVIHIGVNWVFRNLIIVLE